MKIIFLILSVLAFASIGQAETNEVKEEAKEFFEKGVKFFTQKRYVEAIESFTKSFSSFEELGENVPEILYNIAVCYERIGKFKAAISVYQRYTWEKEEIGISADERKEIQKRIERLKKIDITKPLEEMEQKPIVTKLSVLDARVTLLEKEIRKKKKFFWEIMRPAYLFWGAGGIILGAGGVYGIKRLLEARALEKSKTQLDAWAYKKKVKKYALTANILYGVGAATVAAGMIWFTVDMTKKKKSKRESKEISLSLSPPPNFGLSMLINF